MQTARGARGQVLARPAPPSRPPLLVAGLDTDPARTGPFSKGPVLWAVARGSVPHVVEATVFPALVFYALVLAATPGVAMIAVLAWTYGAVLRRVAVGRAVPTILVLATLGLTVRTLVGLLSGSTFLYFVQPVATTVVLAGFFLGSVLVGRPVIGRLAHDFCPLAPEVASRPAIVQLFAGLTVLWASVHLLTAAATFGLLVSLPVATFVALKTVACFGITIGAVVLTVTWSLRIARREDLVFADLRAG
jgi:hypothetical protein